MWVYWRRVRIGSRAVKEFSWLTASTQISTVASMLAFVVLVRTTSPLVTGQVVLAQSIAALVLLVLDVRFEDAVQYYFPNIRPLGDQRAALFFWKVVRFDAAFGLVVAGITGLVWWAGILPDTSAMKGNFIALAICAGAAGTAAGTLKSGFAVTDSLTHYGRLSAGIGICTALLMSFGAVIGAGEGYLAAAVLGNILQVIFLVRPCMARIEPPRAQNNPLPDGFFRYLAKSSVATSFALGAENGSLAVAGSLGGPLLPAVLKVGQAPGRVVQAFFSPISAQAFPRIAASAASGDKRRIVQLTSRATILVLIIGIVGLAVAVPTMSALVSWVYGQEYKEYAGAATIFLVSGILRSAFAWAKVYPLAVGRPGLRMWTTVVDSVLTLACTWFVVSTIADPKVACIYLAGIGALQSAVFLVFWLIIRRHALPEQELSA